jgi:hypothetical protein
MPQGIGGPFQGSFQGKKPQKKADIPTYVADVKTYAKNKRTIQPYLADETAIAKAIIEFESAVLEFEQVVDEFERDYPVPKKARSEFNGAVDKFTQSHPDEPPQKALDDFKQALDKFKRAHLVQPPRHALDKFNAAIDKLKEAFDKFRKEHPDVDPNEWRKQGPYPLTANMQQTFINVERPNAVVDSTYARVAATLDQPGKYPPHLVGLARRILQDGVQHESRFNAIQGALKPFKEELYLRDMKRGSATASKVRAVLDLRDKIIVALREAYSLAARDDIGKSNEGIAAARTTMQELLDKGEQLADAEIGIPFFEDWPRDASAGQS